MPGGYRHLSSLLLTAAFLAPAITTGCATRTYRTYDPYYNDYHRWDNHENVYYHHWIVENHRDNRDYRRLNHEKFPRNLRVPGPVSSTLCDLEATKITKS